MKNLSLLEKLYLSLGVLSGIVLVFFMLRRPGLEADTIDVVNNSIWLQGCIEQHKLTGCFVAGQYPLFQIIPSVILSHFGVTQSAIVHLLAYFSAVCFATIVFETYKILKSRGPHIALFATLILLSGYDIVYANSSFGEIWGASLILAMVAGIVTRKHFFWTAALAFYSGLTKEPAPIFVWIFAMTSYLVLNELTLKRVLQFGCIGLLSIGCNVAFNIFRFSSPWNLNYMDPINFVELPRQLEQIAGLWFSPRGGLAFFWPSFFLLVLGSFSVSRRLSLSRQLPFYMVALALFLLTVLFSKIKVCFGWVSWGPRYLLPWLPASIFILLFAYASALREKYLPWAQKNFTKFSIWMGVISFLSVPEFRVLLRHSWVEKILVQTPHPGWDSQRLMHDMLWPMDNGIQYLLLPGEKPLEWLAALFLASFLFYFARRAVRVSLAVNT